MAASFLDTYTGAAGALPAHTPDTGTFSELSFSGHDLYLDGAGNLITQDFDADVAFTTQSMGPFDVSYAECEVVFSSFTFSGFPAYMSILIAMRDATDAQRGRAVLVCDGGSGSLTGSVTSADTLSGDSFSASPTLVAGTPYVLRLERDAVAGDFKVKLNGTVVATMADPDPSYAFTVLFDVNELGSHGNAKVTRVEAGEPLSAPPFTGAVTGFSPVQFGLPSSLNAAGFSPVHFGQASFALFTNQEQLAVAPLRPVRFGTPAIAHANAPAVQGFHPARFGHPVAVRFAAPTHRTHMRVLGFRPVRFGLPTT